MVSVVQKKLLVAITTLAAGLLKAEESGLAEAATAALLVHFSGAL
jgi:hypothetical protein